MIKTNRKISNSILCTEITKKTKDQDVSHKCTITDLKPTLGLDLYISLFYGQLSHSGYKLQKLEATVPLESAINENGVFNFKL